MADVALRHKCFYYVKCFLENAGYEDLYTDDYENNSAEDTCLACEVRTCALADKDTDKADNEGYNRYNKSGDNCGEKVIFRNGKAD